MTERCLACLRRNPNLRDYDGLQDLSSLPGFNTGFLIVTSDFVAVGSLHIGTNATWDQSKLAAGTDENVLRWVQPEEIHKSRHIHIRDWAYPR